MITSMIMALNEAVQEVPPEYGNDGAEWQLLGILFIVIPILSVIVSFFTLNKFTENKTHSVIGTIIGFIGAFIIGIAIPIILKKVGNKIYILCTIFESLIGTLGVYNDSDKVYYR
jgi:Na+/melibiose symporter-like transporter